MVVAEVCSSMKYPKRCQYKHAKQKKYHVRNWAEYNEGLRRRGDLTVWFDEEAIANWKADKTGEPGGQRVYSDMAIETGLVVRMVYKLAYRQTEGFLHSIASLLGLGIEIPDYSTLCRRSRLLRKKLRILKAASTQPIHLMIDSTGLRIHVGNARKPPKQRAWRKLHIAVDRETGNIVVALSLPARTPSPGSDPVERCRQCVIRDARPCPSCPKTRTERQGRILEAFSKLAETSRRGTGSAIGDPGQTSPPDHPFRPTGAPELLCGGAVVIAEQAAQSLTTSHLPVRTADAFFRFEQRPEPLMVALTGITMCYLWYRMIRSYDGLNGGKFKVIHAIEARLPLALYDTEWGMLGRGEDRSVYWPFTKIERWVPWIFVTIYLHLAFSTQPWWRLVLARLPM